MDKVCCLCLKDKPNRTVMFISGSYFDKTHLICKECRRKNNLMLQRNIHQSNLYLSTSMANQPITQLPTQHQNQTLTQKPITQTLNCIFTIPQIETESQTQIQTQPQPSLSFDCIFCNETHEYSYKNITNSNKRTGCSGNCCLVV